MYVYRHWVRSADGVPLRAPSDYVGPGFWTVGYYYGESTWVDESEHSDRVCAAMRTSYLNGGTNLFIPTCGCDPLWGAEPRG